MPLSLSESSVRGCLSPPFPLDDDDDDDGTASSCLSHSDDDDILPLNSPIYAFSVSLMLQALIFFTYASSYTIG